MNPPRTSARPVRLTRRHWLCGAGFAGLLGAGTAAYIRLIEPRRLEVTQHLVPLRASDVRPLRLLHLSDLHASDCVPLEFIAVATTGSVTSTLAKNAFVTVVDGSTGTARQVLRGSGLAGELLPRAHSRPGAHLGTRTIKR